MIVSEVMISPVVVTQKNKSVEHIRGLVTRKEISAIPILNMSGEIEGIVTTKDLAKEENNSKTAEDVMTQRVCVIPPNSGIREAAKMMTKHHIHHVVVMEDGQVVGMVSALDIVELVANNQL